MKKILAGLGIILLIVATVHARNSYQTYVSTTTSTLYNGPCRVNMFVVVNSSNVAQSVYIGDNSTGTTTGQKMHIYVGATAFEKVEVPSYIKFDTNLKATSQDTYDNDKVKLIINVQ